MGFAGLPPTEKLPISSLQGISFATLHKMQCQICPLNHAKHPKHPHQKPWGATNPIVYMLGDAPSEVEDRNGKPFQSSAGKLIRERIPDKYASAVRWNNATRTMPAKAITKDPNTWPSQIVIECCRPSIVQDIEASKPEVIFGFGPVVLQWAIQQTGLAKWNGRRVPIKVGNHKCWFYPMHHPRDVIAGRRVFKDGNKYKPRGLNDYGSEQEFCFALDLKNAFNELDSLPEPIIHTSEFANKNCEYRTGSNGWKDVEWVQNRLRELYDEPIVGMDYETNRLRPYEDGAKLLTVALSSARGTFAFPFEHKQAKWTEEQLDRVYTYFINFLHKANCRKVVHQLAFEMEWSAVFFGKSILRCKPWGDSVTQAFVLDERMKMGKPDALSLEFLTVQYFGLNLKHLSDIDRLDLDNEPLDQVLTYNNLDAKYHRLLYIEQAARIKKEDLLTVYHNQLHRVPTMVLTQMKGLPVDQVRVMEFKKFYESIISRVEEEIADQPIIAQYKSLKGAKFRPSANEDVLFLVRKVIKQGIKNVDEKSLADVHHPVIPLLIEHRKASKNLSTYVKPVMPGSPCLFPDGKLHPIISTTRTRTSRTASDSPNVQNWPKRKNKKIRSQIRGKLNQKIVSFDYGQIQARNVAMESLDKALVKAFWDRYDIHADWVERIVKKYPAWVPGGVKFLKDPDVFKALRNKAKNEFVFPSFFGAQAKSLSRYLGVPVEITERLHDDFWEMFPEIKDWQKGLIKTYFKTGYVTGLSGFRRRAPISPNELINAPIQADECLIVCDAMTRLSKYDEPRFQASMEIHDDLTFIWEQQEIEKNAEVAIREMLTCPYDWINVPIVVEMSIGDDWSNGKEVAHFASDLWEGKDPFKGTWADGTGWANAKGMEKARGSK